MAGSFIGGGNRGIGRKPPTCRKSLTNFITYCCIKYTSPLVGIELDYDAPGLFNVGMPEKVFFYDGMPEKVFFNVGMPEKVFFMLACLRRFFLCWHA